MHSVKPKYSLESLKSDVIIAPAKSYGRASSIQKETTSYPPKYRISLSESIWLELQRQVILIDDAIVRRVYGGLSISRIDHRARQVNVHMHIYIILYTSK
jgi:hypothetical protein